MIDPGSSCLPEKVTAKILFEILEQSCLLLEAPHCPLMKTCHQQRKPPNISSPMMYDTFFVVDLVGLHTDGDQQGS
jgi:hypothetical protein